MLQYRSVAFVTYVSELSAQFAKEAMACQSLDNDEILNVRWATEDPNPTAKVQEQERILAIGRDAIRERMDPRIVEAMRSVRALEEGKDVREVGIADDDEEVDEEEVQRRELEALAAQDESEGDGEGGRPEAKRRRIEANEDNEGVTKSIGLLNADTMEGLKYFSEIRKRHENGNSKVMNQAAAPKPLGKLALDYGSGSDED